ncbi:MAG: hypothetical protein RIC06_22480 [Cyclobacteriaceae bacterium]
MEILIAIILTIGFVLLMRLIGAWMLRIDEVISLLKDIRRLLNNGSDHISKNAGNLDDDILRKAKLYDERNQKT